MKIYCVKILDISDEKIEKLGLSISEDKKSKIDRFVYKRDKIRALIGEILIRTIINEDLGVRNKYIKFEKNQYGKPYLKKYPKFNFNISHSGDFVLCATDNKPIGIDIEKIKYIKYEDIAKRFFTISEFDYIVKDDPDMQLSKFYEIWTLKESYIKCSGQGLTIPLESFSIDIDKFQNIKVIIDNKHNEYIFKRFDMESNYKISVCSLNKEISSNIIKINQNDLLNKYFNLL